tara:strand:+ start:8888 stop:10153 length:1266 start_codon:yes stop_codon:yes gene_type:complete
MFQEFFPNGWEILVPVFLLVFSAFFSFAEASVFAISSTEISSRDNSSAKILKKVVSDPEQLSMCLMVGYNLANISLALLTTQYVVEFTSESNNQKLILGSVALLNFFLVTTFAEIIPRLFAIKKPYEFALKISYLLYFFTLILSIPAFLIKKINQLFLAIIKVPELSEEKTIEREVQSLASDEVFAESVEEDEVEMIQGVLNLEDLKVKDVMVPRIEVDAIEKSSKLSDVFEFVSEKFRSRYPVYNERIDNIVGVLHVKDILGEDLNNSIETYINESLMFSPDMPLDNAFKSMRNNRKHLAVVLDEYGGMDGIVTVEDLLEEVVGQIEDEYQLEDPDLVEANEDLLIVRPALRVSEVMDVLDLPCVDPPADQVGPLVYKVLGRVPQEGDSVEWGEVFFKVVDMDGTQIKRLEVTKIDEELS